MSDENPAAQGALEPLEEVLEQVSEQALRVNHVDAALKELSHSMTDLAELTHTGLVELRGLLAAGAQGADPLTEGWQHSVNERLEELEHRARGAARARFFIFGLLALQAALLIVVLLVSTGTIGDKKPSESFSFAPPTNASSPPAVKPATPAPTTPPFGVPANREGKAKRRARYQ